ncbi:MAG: hypothetical protein U9N84_02485 [Actinomycetota bacterium]|nr:hypothetical protein [Actinomycetota bacterium]
MQKLRGELADILIGIVVVLVAWWLLKGVFQVVRWAATLLVLAILIVVVLRIASKIRGK